MNTLEVEFKIPEEKARVILDSVNIEAEKDFHSRSKVRFNYSHGKFIMRVEASDLSAMRAAVNTYLRWIIMCENLINKKK
ncbi:MAG: KEOPS complex subunit Pcc1 [Candidatus Altiarchaeota archaeon]|nr:KEOPS complex subunit Pcc1 [Candidatus Altiarchaeota archaeon]